MRNGTPRRSGIASSPGMASATKLRKGDHIYVEGTLVSSSYEKEFGKGKSKIAVPVKAWQVKADSIRKLSRTKKDQAPDKVPVDTQPADISVLAVAFEEGLGFRGPLFSRAEHVRQLGSGSPLRSQNSNGLFGVPYDSRNAWGTLLLFCPCCRKPAPG